MIGHLSKRRLQIYPNYKRALDKQLLNESVEPKTEEQLLEEEFRIQYNTQRNMLVDLLPAFGIPVLYFQDWEGDDIIYILSKLAKDSIVVSDDKDLLQLIREDETGRCRVRRAMRDEFWDINTLKENNMDVNEFIACKAIVGDNSDNIPSSCFQVGEKTAPDLYKLYKESTLMVGGFPKDEKELAEKCKLINLPKRKAYLNFNEEQFLTNIQLTDLRLIDKEIDNALLEKIQDVINNSKNKIDDSKILTKYKEYEFNTLDDILKIRVLNLQDALYNEVELSETNKAVGTLF